MCFLDPVVHPFRLILAVAALILGLPLVHKGQSQSTRQMITVAGKKMSFTSFGLGNRRPGEPVVIFEAGFGATGAVEIAYLYPALSKAVAGIGYDRNGEGESEEDSTIITDVDIVRRLHLFLETAHIPPPYLLVGHSMGGPYIRLFTALYPGEVAGLLFIDATDFMLTDQQDEQIKILSKSGQGTKAWVVPYQDSLASDTMLSLRTRHRVKRLANFFRNGDFWRLYSSLPPLPDIPVAVLAAYNKPMDSSRLTAGQLARIPLAEQCYMENFTAMIRNNHNSFVMLLPRYPHGIHTKDPELVVMVIKRLLQSIAARPVITVAHPPIPVVIDGRTTLYYELQAIRGVPTRIEVADTVFDENAIAGRTKPGDTSIIYMEVALDGPAPDTLVQHVVMGGVPIRVDVPVVHTPPIVLSPPLRGGPWAAVRDPSWERGHRRVMFTIDGRSRIPGRFAVDFILLDSVGKYARGNEDSIRNWYGYGAEVLAVADGVVVKARDDFAESPTLSGHPKYPAEQATGNFVCLQIGQGQFVFYEHLKPGSIHVRPGQKVRRGQPIARLGFTGQTTGPHLHLHVADSDSPLGSEGLPFVFERFTVLGGYEDFGVFGKGAWTAGGRGVVQKEYPSGNSVVQF